MECPSKGSGLPANAENQNSRRVREFLFARRIIFPGVAKYGYQPRRSLIAGRAVLFFRAFLNRING